MASNGRSANTLVDVQDLRTHFFTESGVVKAVDGVTWDIKESESLALVGESGCGKSVSALSVMRLIANPPGRIIGGKITFEGQDILSLSDEKMRHLRGNRMAM
ncbi:MAG: oligopeptide/dipeptide transporter, ATPase subunit, partial [Dehalococcoidia bacterium]|nr:oligopeptide/dipeptide transporter, ATPase subunit [Dehalococcoidia bacterium]